MHTETRTLTTVDAEPELERWLVARQRQPGEAPVPRPQG